MTCLQQCLLKENAHHVTPTVAQGFSACSDPILPTIPASSGGSSTVVLIRNSLDVRSTVPVMDLIMMDVALAEDEQEAVMADFGQTDFG